MASLVRIVALALSLIATTGAFSFGVDAAPTMAEGPLSNNGRAHGTGKNVGSGWRPGLNSRIHGTGKNVGSGWRPGLNGRIHGTGKNVGSGWRVGPDGRIHGTGRNTGRGWRDAQGVR